MDSIDFSLLRFVQINAPGRVQLDTGSNDAPDHIKKMDADAGVW